MTWISGSVPGKGTVSAKVLLAVSQELQGSLRGWSRVTEGLHRGKRDQRGNGASSYTPYRIIVRNSTIR